VRALQAGKRSLRIFVRASEQAACAQADMRRSGMDAVVVQLQAEAAQQPGKLACGDQIGGAGLGIAGRMAVVQHDGPAVGGQQVRDQPAEIDGEAMRVADKDHALQEGAGRIVKIDRAIFDRRADRLSAPRRGTIRQGEDCRHAHRVAQARPGRQDFPL